MSKMQRKKPRIWENPPAMGCEKKREWLAENKPFSRYALLWLYAAGGGDVTNETAREKYLADMKDFMADQ